MAAPSPYLGLKAGNTVGVGGGREWARPGPGLPSDDVLQVLVPQCDSGLPSNGPAWDCALCRDMDVSSWCLWGTQPSRAHSHPLTYTLGCKGQEERCMARAKREVLGCAAHNILKSASMKMGSAPVSLAMASRSR